MSKNEFQNFDAMFEQTLAMVNNSTKKVQDVNQFRPSVNDERSEYMATVRFIPPLEGPLFVKKIVHYIRVGNSKIPMICPKTADDNAYCAMCSQSIQDRQSKIPNLIERAKEHSNRLRWISNVLVLEDSVNPSNVGRVLWWEFPNQIMEYINKLNNPPNSRIPRINAYNPFNGADFFMCLKKVDGYPKYEGSQFLQQTAISESAEEIHTIRSMCHDLSSLVTIPTAEEIAEVLGKSGDMGVTNKVYSNVPDRSYQSTGFGQPIPFIPVSGAAAIDEFNAPAGQTEAVKAPVRPPLVRPETVMPPAGQRVAPIPTQPAQPQPHVNKPVMDDNDWMN